MDPRLIAWGQPLRRRSGWPALWLFTDQGRLADPRAAIARLPAGAAGVVFRHDGVQDRAALGQEIARLCRTRRLVLVVAGDARLAAALHAGMHLRGGRWPSPVRTRGPITSSAHNPVEVRRARRAGAALVFLSPVFPTPSHPRAPALGVSRWTRIARQAGVPIAALGGVDARSARRLPRRYCAGMAGIAALA